MSLLRTLIEGGVDLNGCDKYGKIALIWAVEEVARFRPRPENWWTEKEQAANVLISAGANVTLRSWDGTDALHVAALSGVGGIIKSLINAGAGINALNMNGESALHLALHPGYSDTSIATILIENGAETNTADNEKMTPLHMAVGRDSAVKDEDVAKLVLLLLEAGADANAKDWEGNTPLIIATEQRQYLSVSILLENGAHVGVSNFSGITALHVAVTNGDIRLEELLVENCVGFEEQCINEVMELAAVQGRTSLIQRLQDKGLIELKDSVLLHWANLFSSVERGDIITAQSLLQLEFEFDLEVKDIEGNFILHLAVGSGVREMVVLILDYGTKVAGKTSQGPYALRFASQTSRLSVRPRPAHGTAVESWGERTALHFAIECGQESIVQLLLERGAPIEAVRCDGLTPLLCAVRRDKTSIAKLLLDYGADISCQDTIKGNTVLHNAFIGQETMLRLLLDHGANVEKRNYRGGTPLHYMSLHGNVAIMDTLINEMGAGIEAEDDVGNRPLHNAVESGQESLVQFLVDSGADFGAKKQRGDTPLHLAVLAYPEAEAIVRILLDNGADINAIDDSGDTAFQLARRRGCDDIADFLLSFMEKNDDAAIGV